MCKHLHLPQRELTLMPRGKTTPVPITQTGAFAQKDAAAARAILDRLLGSVRSSSEVSSMRASPAVVVCR